MVSIDFCYFVNRRFTSCQSEAYSERVTVNYLLRPCQKPSNRYDPYFMAHIIWVLLNESCGKFSRQTRFIRHLLGLNGFAVRKLTICGLEYYNDNLFFVNGLNFLNKLIF